MRNEVLLALISKLVEDRLEDTLRASEAFPKRGPRGLRGPQGDAGRDGKDFIFSEYEGKIKEWAKEFALKFSDLSSEDIDKLKGRDGRDGHDFLFEEHREEITSIISSEISKLDLKLKFSDLSEEDRESLKLKISDLTEEDRESLRGPRGQRGRPGKSFVFDEHIEFFNSLKLKFTDLTDKEIESLKLKFSDLTEDDREKLKLRFEHLSEEDIERLRGPRGQRGRPGRDGKDGESIVGPRGEIGPKGEQGKSVQGPKGMDGKDGEDAPIVEEIDVDQMGSIFSLVFKFSDGSEIETPNIKIPSQGMYIGGVGGAGTGSSGTVPTYADPRSVILNVDCELSVYVGAAVRMKGAGGVDSVMSDWTSLELVTTMDYQIFSSNVAANALADSWANSNVIGIVINKTAENKCDIRFAGVSEAIFLGLLVDEEYYLSDTDPGGMVIAANAPTASGTVILRLGQPFSGSELLIIKGERVLRL